VFKRDLIQVSKLFQVKVIFILLINSFSTLVFVVVNYVVLNILMVVNDHLPINVHIMVR